MGHAWKIQVVTIRLGMLWIRKSDQKDVVWAVVKIRGGGDVVLARADKDNRQKTITTKGLIHNYWRFKA